jgi:tubulin monoglycylase TTLL3/8
MKQSIIGVLLASQENVDPKKGCFELYGADFMLSEDFTPWLIEINSCPCMASTTSITARMCAQCLEDCVKGRNNQEKVLILLHIFLTIFFVVIVDRRANRNADTGMFEMVYRQPLSAVTVQQFTGHDLVIHGKKLTRDIDWPGYTFHTHKINSHFLYK